MNEKLDLSPEEIKEKRRYERFEIYLPVHFRIFNDSGIPFIKEGLDGFSRNYSKEGLLIEFSHVATDLDPDSLLNATIKGDIMLPIADAPIPFEGEIKWIRSFSSTKYFIGVFISYIDDFHRFQLFHFAKRVNRRQKIISGLIFTIIITFLLTIMSIFSFNAYIDRMTYRWNLIFDEQERQIELLTKKINELSSR